MTVRAKKGLGQHFLTDKTIAARIASYLPTDSNFVLEIGPGMGVLTNYLLQISNINLKVIEIDQESIRYLHHHYKELGENLIEGDFLKLDLHTLFPAPFSIIGNFPYNISSQILFRALENRDYVISLTGMFQKEVAERITSPPKCKQYGILSVLLQTFYDIEYLFTVDEHVFNPPPKVKSAVVRLIKNPNKKLACDESSYKHIIKTAFNQRRKTLRNSLRGIDFKTSFLDDPIFQQRPEQLSTKDFEKLVKNIKK